MNLEELGTLLRGRRDALGLTRDGLARRIEVTPTYIFMIESARPRSGGSPSRPKRETLKRWLDVLGFDREEANRALELAGYHPLDEEVERRFSTIRESGRDRKVEADIEERPPITAARGLEPALFAAPMPPDGDLYHSRYLLQRRIDRLIDSSADPAALIHRIMAVLDAFEAEQ